MADVRSLLRQQRDARRIQHPLAAYSDAGKLLCTLCREQIRADSMWDSHLQGANHKQKAAAGARPATRDDDAGAANPKRKLQESSEAMEVDDASRTKRTKAELLAAGLATTESDEDASEQQPARVRTPPSLIRRMSTTPSQGIEIQIPSRPATPAHRDSSSSSTPGGSSLPSAFGATAASSRMQSAIPAAAAATTLAEETPILASSGNGVDEDEWAAFEADIAAASVPYDEDATITAPAMNAEEAAAAAAASGDADSEDVKRKMQADIDIEDEKEEATRAMEDEFDDMQELEARVQRLKDQRAALRQRAESQGQETMPPKPSDLAASAAGAVAANGVVVEEEEEEDEEDSDDEDDFDGFTFRR